MEHERVICEEDEPPMKKQKLDDSRESVGTETSNEGENTSGHEFEQLLDKLSELKENVKIKWNSLSTKEKLKFRQNPGLLEFLKKDQIQNLQLLNSLQSLMEKYSEYNLLRNWAEDMEIKSCYKEVDELYESEIWGHIGPISFSNDIRVQYRTDVLYHAFSFDCFSGNDNEFHIDYGSDDIQEIYNNNVIGEDTMEFDEFNDFMSDFIDFVDSAILELNF